MDTDLTAPKVADADRLRVLEYAAKDLEDIRNLLKEVSARLRQVERRVDFALPPASKAAREKKPELRTSDEASRFVEYLAQQVMADKSIESELRGLPVKGGLLPIARQLGLTNTRLPPKAELVLRIETRIRQGAAVRSGILR